MADNGNRSSKGGDQGSKGGKGPATVIQAKTKTVKEMMVKAIVGAVKNEKKKVNPS